MSEAKHTPGPWYAFTEPHFSGWWSVRDSDEWEIGSGDGGFEEPDARLIAAAPELLHIASTLASLAEGLHHGNSAAEDCAARLAEQAKAVLDQIKGQQ